MKHASYQHHMGHVAVIVDGLTVKQAQRDAATWHQVAVVDTDNIRDQWSRDNAAACQRYSAMVSKAVRVALEIEA